MKNVRNNERKFIAGSKKNFITGFKSFSLNFSFFFLPPESFFFFRDFLSFFFLPSKSSHGWESNQVESNSPNFHVIEYQIIAHTRVKYVRNEGRKSTAKSKKTPIDRASVNLVLGLVCQNDAGEQARYFQGMIHGLWDELTPCGTYHHVVSHSDSINVDRVKTSRTQDWTVKRSATLL